MKKILLLLFLCGTVLPQGTHFRQKLYFDRQLGKNALQPDNRQPQKRIFKKEAALDKIVFGYLPYWVYYQNRHSNIRYDLLSHVAVFSFDADSLGNLTPPLNWPWNDVIENTHSAGGKVIMTVTNFNTEQIHTLLTDAGVRSNLFENIERELTAHNLDGVNIDFENIQDADLQFALLDFLIYLREYIKQANGKWEISFAAPAVGYGKWNFSSIAGQCDFLFVMGYDFYGSWSNTTGPSAPLTGGFFNLTQSLDSDYKQLIESNPEKVVLGVPYYGNYWQTDSGVPYAEVIPFDESRPENDWQGFFYVDSAYALPASIKKWDEISQTPYSLWQSNRWNQVWWDDEVSLELKYNLAIQKKIGGVGIWALGYDGSLTNLWALIEKKFVKTSSVNTEARLPAAAELHQNYPNPFSAESGSPFDANRSTVISWQMNEPGFVSIKIYDLLGREITELVNEFKEAGNHRFVLDATKLTIASGTYFYTLRTGGFSSTKKMVLIR